MSGSGLGRRALLCAACGVVATACGGSGEQPTPSAGSSAPPTTSDPTATMSTRGAASTSVSPDGSIGPGSGTPTVGPGETAGPPGTGSQPSHSSGGGPVGGPGTSSAAPSASPTAGPTSSTPTVSSTPSPTAPAGYLGPTSEVPVGGGRVYSGRNVVVTQPSSGRFVGMTATCPHQGREVGAVTGGVVECGYHGSLFSIEDGSVVHGPAPRGLDPVSIDVSDGQIWLAG